MAFRCSSHHTSVHSSFFSGHFVCDHYSPLPSHEGVTLSKPYRLLPCPVPLRKILIILSDVPVTVNAAHYSQSDRMKPMDHSPQRLRAANIVIVLKEKSNIAISRRRGDVHDYSIGSQALRRRLQTSIFRLCSSSLLPSQDKI